MDKNSIHRNPVFEMKNNGWKSQKCRMTQGIRQGCPLSALLILFRAEILATKLETNENISEIRINDCEIRNIQHADDLTITVQDENFLRQALNTVHEFCKHAGSKINMNKTKCILLGPLKDAYDENHV